MQGSNAFCIQTDIILKNSVRLINRYIRFCRFACISICMQSVLYTNIMRERYFIDITDKTGKNIIKQYNGKASVRNDYK